MTVGDLIALVLSDGFQQGFGVGVVIGGGGAYAAHRLNVQLERRKRRDDLAGRLRPQLRNIAGDPGVEGWPLDQGDLEMFAWLLPWYRRRTFRRAMADYKAARQRCHQDATGSPVLDDEAGIAAAVSELQRYVRPW